MPLSGKEDEIRLKVAISLAKHIDWRTKRLERARPDVVVAVVVVAVAVVVVADIAVVIVVVARRAVAISVVVPFSPLII